MTGGVPAVLAVVGPTASGKTALALELAEHFGTEIISADSMQFYRGMEIGTAAPTPTELGRTPHHFVGFLDPNETMAAGVYQSLARDVVSKLNANGKPAIVVGGSGLYVAALIDGLFDGPPRNGAIQERLREEARVHGSAALMDRLRKVDPAYAETLTSGNDLVRIIRALEVYEVAGRPFSDLHREHRADAQALTALQIALDHDRGALYERINARVDSMIAEGWVEEVRGLIDAGYGKEISRLKALGYREIAAHLEGKQTLEKAVEASKRHHRRYAKRQITWFRGDERVQWLPVAEVPEWGGYVREVEQLIARGVGEQARRIFG